MTASNLLIHFYPRYTLRSDFDGMAERVRAIAPEISVEVLETHRFHPAAMLATALSPTASVEFKRAKYFRCIRGRTYRHWHRAMKVDEMRVLDDAGIPVPKWVEVTPETRLDPSEWGEYVVEKPNAGRNGAYVRLRRTGRVRHRSPEELEPDNPARESGLIAQKLIFTGATPISYRVTTLFGTPLMAVRYDGARGDWFTVDAGGRRKISGATVVATGKGCKISFCNDADILDLARRAHGAFADVPVLGVDIIRDMDDGSLWVLEVNPGGTSWMFGSRDGRKVMASTGLDFYAQFGALDRAAEALVGLCRRQ